MLTQRLQTELGRSVGAFTTTQMVWLTGLSAHHSHYPQQFNAYRIAGNFRLVLIFAISRIVYGVAKIKTAIIYSNRNSKVSSLEITKIKIAKIISHTFTFKSRKFSSAKISRYTVCFHILPASRTTMHM